MSQAMPQRMTLEATRWQRSAMSRVAQAESVFTLSAAIRIPPLKRAAPGLLIEGSTARRSPHS